MTGLERIWLSPPHMGLAERRLLLEAFDSNWIAPLGPHVDAFQDEFQQYLKGGKAVALSSGTAALHLALEVLGVGAGDTVVVSSLTFVGGVNPIRYVGATPVFIDSEPRSWNMDPELLEEYLEQSARRGRLPKAVVPVHLYGQTADMGRILAAAARFEVPVIEDAAEALGADFRGKRAGRMGRLGLFSFNGNKVITTSGGGMLVADDERLIAHALKLATQARETGPHYEHAEIGYNYRLSNLLAAIGRGQLRAVEQRIDARRSVFARYESLLCAQPGVALAPDAEWGRHTRWLTVVLIDPETFGATREDVRLALEEENIEARPIWKPMHLQPVYRGAPAMLTGVSDRLFERGLCLPSGSALTEQEIDRVVAVIRSVGRKETSRSLSERMLTTPWSNPKLN